MIDVNKIIDWISANINIDICKFDYTFYSKIEQWAKWYTGEIPEFHRYKFYNGIDTVDCHRAMLYMAKQVCADTAALAFNENVIINIADEESNKFIQGHDQSGGILAENNFWENATQLYEGGVCALGTAALEVYLEDLAVGLGTGKVIPDKDTKIKIAFIRADHIIPISFENKIIKDVCFINELTINNIRYADLRLHIKEKNGLYTIYNKRLRVDDLGNIQEVKSDNNLATKFETGSSRPFFSIIKTAYNNNFDILGNNPLGVSIYANAVDILKSCDLCYDTLQNEILLGQKFIFLNKSMLDLDEQGKVRTPYDIRQRLFQFIGDQATVQDKNWVHEFNPTLRTKELCEALEKQIDYLSAKVGLGDHFYKISDGSVAKTATEVLAENSSAYRNIRRAQISIEQALINMIKVILYCGKNFLNKNVSVNTNVSVEFDASIIENRENTRQRDLEEVSQGILSKEEYRSKYHAESIEKATKEVEKIDNK